MNSTKENKRKLQIQTINFRILPYPGIILYAYGDVIIFRDVKNFVFCGFGMWMLPYTTLGRRTLLHNIDPNPAEHTKVDTKHSQNLSGSSTACAC